jgi:hypothetical protein
MCFLYLDFLSLIYWPWEKQEIQENTFLAHPKVYNWLAQGVNILCPEGNSQPGHWMRQLTDSPGK